jgi:hypothetical protein
MTTNNTNAAARFLHMKGEDAVIGKALHSARNLLNLIEGNTPAGYAIRALLEGSGLDLTVVRAEVEAALNLPLPEAAPAAPAAPAVLPDVETAVRDAVAKALDSLNIERMARDVIERTVEDNMPDVEEAARELISERVDNDMPDVVDAARELIDERIDNDMPDVEDIARELIDDKVNDNYDVDVDSVAREIVAEKIDDEINLHDIAVEALTGKSVTVTIKT